jgi:hypothetical protein
MFNQPERPPRLQPYRGEYSAGNLKAKGAVSPFVMNWETAPFSVVVEV